MSTHRSLSAEERSLLRRSIRLGAFVSTAGGVLFQTGTGGCDEVLSSAVAALGQPIATGIGNGLSNLMQVLVVGAFI